MTIRTAGERTSDALRRLEHDEDVWIATADATGVPHLVPLSLAWDGGHILVTTPTDSPTVRNATASGRARAALDSTADVVLIDATVEAVELELVERDTLEAFVDRVGWDPRQQSGRWSMLILTPRTILAWNGVAEIEGRTIMRAGAWLS